MTPTAAGEPIGADQFWHLYYSGRLVRLERRAGWGVAGTYDHYADGSILPEERKFTCSQAALAAYGYADWKFSAPVSDSLSKCLINVIESPAMARESAIHWQELELAAQL